MPGQFRFDGQMGLGLGETAAPTDRLFFALFPDADGVARINELIGELRQQHGLRAKALDDDRFHVTLHFLGDYPPGVSERIGQQASQAVSRVRAMPFEVRFDHVSSFAARRPDPPVVLRCESGREPLLGLHAQLGAALRRLGSLVKVERSFEPHLTLMYDRRNIAPQMIQPITWRAKEFVLVRNRKGIGYERLGSWRLAGEPN